MQLPSELSLRHVALVARDLDAMERFYAGVLGYTVEWRPDADNVYLTRGADNLALHRGAPSAGGPLDHVGFAVPAAADVDAWAAHLSAAGFAPEQAPRTHRDGARSLYVRDPDGNLVQIIHHPPIAGTVGR
jgi:catechol 2,3-dioxygenase-like lactoylglutathione lyase family enzyme